MQCTACGVEQQQENKFCTACGEQVADVQALGEIPKLGVDSLNSQSIAELAEIAEPAETRTALDPEAQGALVTTALLKGTQSATLLQSMVEGGISEENARNIIVTAKTEIMRKCMRSFFWGIVWIAVGVSVSIITYSMAASDSAGGTYVILWGPAVYGIYKCGKALYQWFKVNNL